MAGIGDMMQVKLEKWTQSKGPTGSLDDTLVNSYPIWADVRKVSGSRNYTNSQTKERDRIEIKIWWKSAFDINALWKVVYDGRRHTVQSVEKINEKRFKYLLIIESNG